MFHRIHEHEPNHYQPQVPCGISSTFTQISKLLSRINSNYPAIFHSLVCAIKALPEKVRLRLKDENIFGNLINLMLSSTLEEIPKAVPVCFCVLTCRGKFYFVSIISVITRPKTKATEHSIKANCVLFDCKEGRRKKSWGGRRSNERTKRLKHEISSSMATSRL